MMYLLSTAATNSSIIVIGLCVASGGLLLGMAAGKLFRIKSEYQADDESVDLHPIDAPSEGLAGLRTRHAFDTELRRRLDEFQRAGTPFACCCSTSTISKNSTIFTTTWPARKSSA